MGNIFYHDLFRGATVPSGQSAANTPSSLGCGNLWMTALSGNMARAASQSSGALVISATGTSGAATTIYPCSDTGGASPLVVAPTPGMFNIIRLRFSTSPMDLSFYLSANPKSPYSTGMRVWLFKGYGDGSATNDFLPIPFMNDNAQNTIVSNYPIIPTVLAGELLKNSLQSQVYSELDLALCVRKLISGTKYLCEIWARSSLLGNLFTDDWTVIGLAECDWGSGATIGPALVVTPISISTGTQTCEILEWMWGYNDPNHDPGAISRNKAIGYAQTLFPAVKYTVPTLPEPIGVVNIGTGPMVGVMEGVLEVTGDITMNLYAANDSTYASWPKKSQIFPTTTMPAILLACSLSGATYTVTTNAAGNLRTLTLTDSVNGATSINLGSNISYNFTYTLATVLADIQAISGGY